MSSTLDRSVPSFFQLLEWTNRLYTWEWNDMCEFCLRSDGNAIVPLTCFPFACSIERNDCVPLVALLFGTERFCLKCSRLNAILQYSTFRNNTERSGTIAFPCDRDLNHDLPFDRFCSSIYCEITLPTK